MTITLGKGEGLLTAPLVEDPYPFYDELRRHAPVWRVPGTNLFLVSSWSLAAEAAARVEDFSNHFRHTLFSSEDGTLGVVDNGEAGAPDVFAGADPPAHTAHRRVFFPELVQARMGQLEPAVVALADELLNGLLEEESFDAAAALADPLPLRIMAEGVVGFRDADLALVQRWVFAGSRVTLGGRLDLAGIAAAGAEAAGMWPWVAEQLEAALADPSGEDVLGAAAEGVRAGTLSADEAAFTLMVLLGAGAETTTSLIGNAVRILAEHPSLQDELRANLDLVPPFVEEVLRFESPFRFHPRLARGPVELDGVEIPDRAMVALLWGAANRDPAVFERPGEFVLGRSNIRQHLAFGRGIHHCVGAPLARLESRVVLSRLLTRTRRVALAHAPRWVDSLWIRRHERLPVVVEPA